MRTQNGFGSITKLSGNRRKPYGVRVTVGWEGGKQIRKYIGYYKTQPEALLALAEYHKGEFNVELSTLSLVEVYKRWIDRIEPNVSKNVLITHNMAYTRFGMLAKKQMSKIKADHLQDWMDSIDDLSPNSKKRVKSTMIQLYKYAIKNDIVNKNYAEHIEIHEKSGKIGKVFSTQEIETLWKDADNNTAQWILILIYTGLRIGELLALTDENIHLDKRYMIGGMKTKAGTDRIIPIHNAILPIITKQLGNARFLMRDKKGRKLSYTKALEQFKGYMNYQEWEHLPHDTRKTAVSIMHRHNIPMETIRAIVGHSGKGVTEQVYLRFEPEDLVKAINQIKVDYV